VDLEPVTATKSVADGIPPPQLGGEVTRSRSLGLISLRYGMVWALVVLVIVAQSLYPAFLTIGNLRNLMGQNAGIAIIAVGMTLVIICGGFDLSVGSVYGLGAVTFAAVSNHASLIASVLASVLVGSLAGLMNALIITKLNVNPFVATLATSSGFLGIAYVYSDSNPVAVASGHDGLGLGEIAGIPTSGLIAIAVFLAGGTALSRTILARTSMRWAAALRQPGSLGCVSTSYAVRPMLSLPRCPGWPAQSTPPSLALLRPTRDRPCRCWRSRL